MLLTHLGFPYNFIRWIMSCISSISFGVFINGSTSNFFFSKRGLRQGCSLSPLLFLLVAEGLSCFISHTKQSRGYNGLQITQTLHISHLLFVDDILIFCDGSKRDLDRLVQGLNLIKSAVGMVIIEAKSSIVTAQLLPHELHSLAISFPFPTKSVES